MLYDIRFVGKRGRYDKVIAKKVRECVDLAEALRWAAANLDQSEPQDVAAVASVRVRKIHADEETASGLPPIAESFPPSIEMVR